jgi:hypothetical protein
LYLPLILVPSLMIFLVADASEHPLAVLAFVGFLSGVRPQVHHQVALLGEGAPAALVRALEKLQTRMHSLQVQV